MSSENLEKAYVRVEIQHGLRICLSDLRGSKKKRKKHSTKLGLNLTKYKQIEQQYVWSVYMYAYVVCVRVKNTSGCKSIIFVVYMYLHVFSLHAWVYFFHSCVYVCVWYKCTKTYVSEQNYYSGSISTSKQMTMHEWMWVSL